MNDIGLIDRIKAAKTSVEIDGLLAEGKTYKTASKKTQRKWMRVATAVKAKLAKENK